MANNRLYIEDTATGEQLLLAKSYGDGWMLYVDRLRFAAWMGGRDMAASTGNALDNPRSTLRLIAESDPDYKAQEKHDG